MAGFDPERQQVFFVRHGDYGDHRQAGYDETLPLTAAGIDQAAAASEVLALVLSELAVVVSSDRQRAVQTASIIAGAVNLDMQIAESLGVVGEVPELLPGGDLEQFVRGLVQDIHPETNPDIVLVTHAPLVAAVKLGRLSYGEQSTEVADYGEVVKADFDLWNQNNL